MQRSLSGIAAVVALSYIAPLQAQTLEQLKEKYGADLVIGERCVFPETHQFCAPVCKYGLPSGSGPMRCATRAEHDAELAEQAKKPQTATIVQRLAMADAYYAYVAVNQVDKNLDPVRNAAGQPLETRFCLMWKPGWDLNNRNLALLGGHGTFYKHFSYRIDPEKHVLTMYALDAPAAIAYGSGQLKYTGGTRRYRANIKTQLYTQPQPGWPCTQKDWDTDLASVRYHYHPAPQGSGGGGWHPYIGPVHHTPAPRPPCISHYLHPGC